MTRSAAIAPTIAPRIATRLQAEALDREAVKIMAEWDCIWLRLGRAVMQVVDSEAYKALGFATEKAWLEARVRSSSSLSKIFSALRCARYLAGVADEKLTQIGTVNALTLTRLPQSVGSSPEWIKKAMEMGTKELDQAVDAKLGIAPEKFRTWSRPFSEGVSELMDGAEAHLAKKYAMDIAAQPGLRNVLWASVANFILQNEDIELEIGGGE